MLSYFLLLGSAFLAATIFPFYSEAFLVTLLTQGKSVWLLWLFATIGNTLGAVVNWVLGRYLLHFQDHRYFPFKLSQLQRSQSWFQRYGVWSLLLSWLPLIGDGITFIAGIMKVKFWVFLSLTAVGKGLRYLIVILIAQGIMG
ncbi:MAG: YqaA family protein [Cellvibrionaceae bacterium]